MSIQFDGTGFILNSSPAVTAFPYCMGCWMQSFDGNQSSICSLGSSATNTNYFDLRLSSGILGMAYNGGGTEATSSTGVVITTGQWYFIAAGGVSSVSKWVAAYDPSTGIFGSSSGLTTFTPAINRCVIGGRASQSGGQNFNGLISEWFLINANPLGILPAGPKADSVKRIAHYGIWAGEDWSKTSLESYRSFELDVDIDVGGGGSLSNSQASGWNYEQALGTQKWTSGGGTVPFQGPTCPFMYPTAIRPCGQNINNLII